LTVVVDRIAGTLGTLSLPIVQRRTTLARLMEQVLVLVAKLAGELPHHYLVPGSHALSTRGAAMTMSGLSKSVVMTTSNQLAHALVYQVPVCQSPHGPCASLLGVLV
jgi:hypothetical protein